MQHDMVLDNAPGLTFRADNNGALGALVSNSSGASAPATMYAYMFWADTSTGLLKVRNAANSAWVIVGTLADTNLGLLSLAGGTMTGALNEKGFNVAAHATTCDIWSGGNFANLTGAIVTFTDVADAPVADAWRWVRSNAAHILTSNANITVQGGTRTIAAGDILLWHAITTTTFEVFVFPVSGTVADASLTQKGIVELATTAEIKTGTDSTRAIATDQLLAALGFTAYFQSADQTITSAGSLTIAHGLGRTPVLIQAWLKCAVAEANYTIGQMVPIHLGAADAASNTGVAVVPDATNLNVRFANAANVFVGINFTTGAVPALTNTSWRLVLRVWG
jgi:hypothetical protein